MAQAKQFNLPQLVQLAQMAGWSPQDAPTIAAVAMAESGGRAGALNNNRATGDYSFGLTQVNMIDRLGPERLKQFGLQAPEQLFDPLVNLRAAKAIKDSQGWGAWSVVKGGQYKQFLPAAQQALGSGSDLDSGLPSLLTAAPAAVSTGSVSSAAPAAGGLGSLAAAALATPGAAAGGSGTAVRFAGDPSLEDALVTAALGLQPGTRASSSLPAASGAAGAAGAGEDSLDLVSFLKQVQAKGLRVGENPAFGPVGKHAPKSYHYSNLAADLTDWNGGNWAARTAFIGERARQALGGSAEIFHPRYDPVGGHGSHIHFALPSGRLPRNAANQILAGIDEAFRRYPKT